jgi:hypothetical protein
VGPNSCATVRNIGDVAAARPGLASLKQQRAFCDACPADQSSIVISTRRHSRSRSYSTTFLYCQRRPSCRRHTRPRTRRPVIDRLGMITVQRCQNSAPAGFELTSHDLGGSFAVVMRCYPENENRRPSCINAGNELAKRLPLDDFITLDRAGQCPASCTLSASRSGATKFAC